MQLSSPMPSRLAAALQAYYNDGKPTISDTEFDNLKDELVWEGSKVAVLKCVGVGL